MIMIIDNDKKSMDVVSIIDLPTYYFATPSIEDMNQIVKFTEQNPGWTVNTYGPENWDGLSKFKTMYDISKNKYTFADTGKAVNCCTFYLATDKEDKRKKVWTKY